MVVELVDLCVHVPTLYSVDGSVSVVASTRNTKHERQTPPFRCISQLHPKTMLTKVCLKQFYLI